MLYKPCFIHYERISTNQTDANYRAGYMWIHEGATIGPDEMLRLVLEELAGDLPDDDEINNGE